MVSLKYRDGFDLSFFLVVLVLYLVGQVLIGSYLPDDGTWHFDAPADHDFMYYAAIIDQMKHAFPPQNPGYGGVPLSQSFLQYYPTVAVALIFNTYLAMRIINILYLLLFTLVLRRYFPRGWGVGLSMLAAGSVGFGLLNPLGIDLIARGFNHFPFLIALLAALFETEKKWIGYLCLFLLGWLHSFMAFLVFLYLVVILVAQRFDRSALYRAASCFAGLIAAASITLGIADKPFYFPLIEAFRFDLTNLWMHALPALILVVGANRPRIYFMFLVAFIFGMFFHYNPFFPVFILNFTAAWAAMDIIRSRPALGLLPLTMAVLMLAGFIIYGYNKYDSRKGRYVPLIDRHYAAASEWLEKNTPHDAVLLTAPCQPEGTCRLMETRALYLGFFPHVAHLGFDWFKRGEKIIYYFRNPSVYMAESDYIIYGPIERYLFPNFRLEESPVYQDDRVKIWKTVR